MRNSGG
jgi:hypothetical protein